MNKKGRWQLIFNSKVMVFTLGGVFLGFILFNNIGSSILGGILGFAASLFIR